MKPLSLLYVIRIILGILAAAICALYNYLFGFSFTISDLLRGLTITIAFYLVTYYIVKSYFIGKVENARKIISTGIGAYFVMWIVIWSLLSTMLLYGTNIVFAVKGFTGFEIGKLEGNAGRTPTGVLWADGSYEFSRVQVIKGFLPHGEGGSTRLEAELNIWKGAETLQDVLILKLNVTECLINCSATNRRVAFGIALWLAVDEASYDAASPKQLVVRFSSEYENDTWKSVPDLPYNSGGSDYEFNFFIADIRTTEFIEIDLGLTFEQVFKKLEDAGVPIRFAKLKGVEIYIEATYGTCTAKISDIQIYKKGLN